MKPDSSIHQAYPDRKLKWHQLLALHQLYKSGQTSAALTGNAYLNYLWKEKRLIGHKPGSKTAMVARPAYRLFYEQHHKADFERYEAFLTEAGLQRDGKRKYTEEDLTTLMFIYHNRYELKESLTTARRFSSLLFNSSKYLEAHEGLYAVVCQLLGITQFPDRDPKNHQWRLVVDCLNPVAVVLCENLDYLKLPWQALEHNIELWYVGGNNISIIERISAAKLALPLYYSCDWDYAGLQIYSRIKSRLHKKGKAATLLLPHDVGRAKSVASPHHKSKWESGALSGLTAEDFSEEHQRLIRSLVCDDLWIEEETQDLMEVLRRNGVLPPVEV